MEKLKSISVYFLIPLFALLIFYTNNFAAAQTDDPEFEFQFLKGLREELKPGLIKKKFVVSDYIPYGVNWLPYSIRRIKERKRNILLLGSSLIQSHRV